MKLAFVLVILLIIFCFVAGPVLLIWSLNALFDLGIAYNLKTGTIDPEDEDLTIYDYTEEAQKGLKKSKD